MIINILHEETGIDVTFTQTRTWVDKYGYAAYNTGTESYDTVVNKNLDWAFYGASGLKENLSVEPYTSKGSGQIGSTFVNNAIGERFFTLGFKPTGGKERGESFGAHTVLAHLIRIKDATFVVTITYGGTVYTGRYYFSSETSIEGGTITMISTEDVAWSIGRATIDIIYGEGDNPYITKNLPQVLLAFDNPSSKKLRAISFEAVEPRYHVYQKVRGGQFGDSRRITDFKITNTSTGKYCSYTNTPFSTDIYIDTQILRCEDANGVDRIDNLGGDLWVTLQPGINDFKFEVNKISGDEVPPDTTLSISYDLRVDVIE